MRTHYTFTTDDGQRYTTIADSRTDAQRKVENLFGISLLGAAYEITCKKHTIETGTIRS